MKQLIFLLILQFSLSLFANQTCTNEDLELANSILKEVTDQYNAHVTSLANLNAIKESVLEVKFCAGKIDKTAYCNGKTFFVNKRIEEITSAFSTPTISDYTQTLEKLINLRKNCN